jgi:hypothetical protein
MEAISQSLGSRTVTAFTVLVVWVSFCRGLRFVRRDRRHAQSPYKTREDFKKMTGEDAFQIVNYVQGLEFPYTSGKALAFALFK